MGGYSLFLRWLFDLLPLLRQQQLSAACDLKAVRVVTVPDNDLASVPQEVLASKLLRILADPGCVSLIQLM